MVVTPSWQTSASLCSTHDWQSLSWLTFGFIDPVMISDVCTQVLNIHWNEDGRCCAPLRCRGRHNNGSLSPRRRCDRYKMTSASGSSTWRQLLLSRSLLVLPLLGRTLRFVILSTANTKQVWTILLFPSKPRTPVLIRKYFTGEVISQV